MVLSPKQTPAANSSRPDWSRRAGATLHTPLASSGPSQMAESSWPGVRRDAVTRSGPITFFTTGGTIPSPLSRPRKLVYPLKPVCSRHVSTPRSSVSSLPTPLTATASSRSTTPPAPSARWIATQRQMNCLPASQPLPTCPKTPLRMCWSHSI